MQQGLSEQSKASLVAGFAKSMLCNISGDSQSDAHSDLSRRT